VANPLSINSKLMGKNIGVDPEDISGLQATLHERLWAAHGQQDRTIIDQLNAFFRASPDRRAMFAEGRDFKEATIVKIDCSKTFDPVAFIGKGWSIVEQDERSLALTQIELGKIDFDHMLKKGETRINGEDKLNRLKKDDRIRLDAKVFQTLWENQSLIPASWKEKTNGNTTYIFFDGTVLQDPDGDRCVLYLYWSVGGWLWSYYWLGIKWNEGYPSALLRK